MLTGTAMVLGIFVGIPLGVLSAVRQYSKMDFVLTGVTFLGISLPSFMLGLGGLYLLGLQLDLVPIAGMITVGPAFELVDFLHHLVLPALILGFGYMAIFMRYTRAAMLDVIHLDYITTARSKGLRGSTILTRHAFRNALIPIITIIGLSIPEVVGAAVVTEKVFTWPGLGLMMVEGIQDRDFLLIMGITMVLAIVGPDRQPADRRRLRLRRPADPVQLTGQRRSPVRRQRAAPAAGPDTASPGRRALRRFLRHRLAIVGLITIGVITVLAIVGSEEARA